MCHKKLTLLSEILLSTLYVNIKSFVKKNSTSFITIHPTNQEGAHGNVKVDLEITMPKTVVLAVNTGHGDIKIAGVGGAIAATSQEGSVEIHDSGSDVSATITKGDARIMNVAGAVKLSRARQRKSKFPT